MTSKEKSYLRMVFAIISFGYVLTFCTIAFGFHLAGFEVLSFWPIFSGVIGYLTSLQVANYLSTPKDTQ